MFSYRFCVRVIGCFSFEVRCFLEVLWYCGGCIVELGSVFFIMIVIFFFMVLNIGLVLVKIVCVVEFWVMVGFEEFVWGSWVRCDLRYWYGLIDFFFFF